MSETAKPNANPNDDAPLQHVGAQEQIPNVHIAKYRKRVVEAPKKVVEPPAPVEEKAAEAETVRATYKTRESAPSHSREKKKAE